jgi:hypothetical protein
MVAIAAGGLLALGGAGLAGCGDDAEGPAEDAGKLIDKGSKKAGKELHQTAKDAERELEDGEK